MKDSATVTGVAKLQASHLNKHVAQVLVEDIQSEILISGSYENCIEFLIGTNCKKIAQTKDTWFFYFPEVYLAHAVKFLTS